MVNLKMKRINMTLFNITVKYIKVIPQPQFIKFILKVYFYYKWFWGS